MSIITAHLPEVSLYSKDLFSLHVNQYLRSTSIKLSMHISVVNTQDLPHTYEMLELYLPSIYTSLCFNKANLPFSKEVVQTEIGHLFEHILLEYLCGLQVQQGASEATFDGVTRWDWKVDPHGTFHITIEAGRRHKEIFEIALQKSIELLEKILTKKNKSN